MGRAKKSNALQSVQWYSCGEWRRVYRLLFGPGSDLESLREALQLMTVWKCRNPYLPVGIESTLGLLEVEMQYRSGAVASDRPLRLMYSSAVMRFINHAMDDAQTKRRTLMEAAAELGIPQWMVDLRHEAAHGHELPPLHVLLTAARFSMNWLHDSYWSPTSQTLTDYVVLHNHDDETFRDDAHKLLSVYNSIVAFMHPSFGIERTSHIPDPEIRQSLMEDVDDILGGGAKQSSALSDVAKSLLDKIDAYLSENGHVPENRAVFAALLTDSESLFMSADLDGLLLWEPLLIAMTKRGFIVELIKEMLNIACDVNDTPLRRKRAAAWIKCIYEGFNSSKSLTFARSTKHKLKDAEEENHRCLKLFKSAPYEICNITFISEIVKKVHQFSFIYLKDVILSCRPPLDEKTVTNLLYLVSIMEDGSVVNKFNDRIYTKDDVLKLCISKTNDDSKETNEYSNSKIWTLFSGNCDWGKYPIGMLPWQNQSHDNPLL